MKRFLKVIDCTQQLQVRENVMGFEKALGAAEVIKDQIQYRSQSLLNLARGYVRTTYHVFCMRNKEWSNPELLQFYSMLHITWTLLISMGTNWERFQRMS